jgi:hypothetical protein
VTRGMFFKSFLATLGLGQSCITSSSDPNYKCPEPPDPKWMNQEHTNQAFSILIADLDERVKKLEAGRKGGSK